MPKKLHSSSTYRSIMNFRHITVDSYAVSDIRPHWHNYFEYELFLEGSGTITINNKTYPIKRGTLYFINVPDIHSAKPDAPAKILNASFDSTLIKDENVFMFLSNAVSTIMILNEEEIEYLSTLHFMLKNESDSIIPLTRLHATAILEAIIIFILKKSHENSISINKGISGSYGMQEAIKYINAHFTEKISLEKIANKAFLSKEHFSRKFHEYSGESFSEYLLGMRMKYAKTLLATSSMPIAEAALRAGFTSATYFSRTFRKSFGITPNEYRKTLKEAYRDSMPDSMVLHE